MFRVWHAALALGIIIGTGSAAHAGITVHVDINTQRMTVRENGETVAIWPVSTARQGKVTPTGRWRPVSMHRMHYSSLYDNAPMPFTIFFNGNYAIHGTTQVRQLGRPASAGCVRLSPAHARELFAMVQRRGMGATQIAITRGGVPDFAPVIARRPAPPAEAVRTAVAIPAPATPAVPAASLPAGEPQASSVTPASTEAAAIAANVDATPDEAAVQLRGVLQ